MAQPHRVFITGVSSGIGEALALEFLKKGSVVYGTTRKECPKLDNYQNFVQLYMDLESENSILDSLSATKLPPLFNLVILNAGQIGEIRSLMDSSLEQMQRLMQVHVWANQTLMQFIFQKEIVVHQLVGISSGAAVNGNQGWSGYSISKAAFNMWISLLSKDFPITHMTALAPGLVDTKMQDYLCEEADSFQFESVARIQANRGTENMPKPENLAPKLLELFPKLKSFPSGSFQDIRKM